MTKIIKPKGMYGAYKCSKCDSQVRSDSNFCWNCGAKFNNEKTYKCNVCLNAEDMFEGVVYLTEDQYKATKYATDTSNWEKTQGGSWHGWFHIYCDEIDAEGK